MTFPVGFQQDEEGYYIYKAAGAVKDYSINFAKWLAGDTLDTVTWTVPAGIVKVSESNDATKATIDLSGGTKDHNYTISCTVTTVANNTETVEFRVVIN